MKTLKKIVYHILALLIILSINIALFGGYFGHEIGIYKLFLMINTPIWAIYLMLFYVNYCIYIPKLLFSHSIIAYIFCSFTTIGLSYVAVQEFKSSDIALKMQLELPQLKRINDNEIDDKYGKTPLLSSINNNRKTSDKRINISEKTIGHDHFTKRQPYGDLMFFQNTVTGVRTIKRFRNRDIYNFSHAHNITQIYILLLIFAMSLVLGAIEKSQQRSRYIDKISREKMSSEILFLKQQINPHFLFNTLNSIYSLVLPHSDQASDAVIKLSSILRYMLYETDKPQVSLDKEMEVIRDYIDLQKFKFTDITNVTMDIDNDLRGYTIEPLLLITFIENAFKYGADNVTPSFINIKASVEKDCLLMSVSNKIVVRKIDDENSGIGIKNVKRRLDLIYQNKYKLDINHTDDIFSVTLKLKLT